MNPKTLQTPFLITAIVLCVVLVFYVLQPFLIALSLAIVFATVLHPLYHAIHQRMDHWPGFAALITILILAIGAIVPLTYIASQIVGDAQNLYVSLSDGSSKNRIDMALQQLNSEVAQVAPRMALSGAELSTVVNQTVKNVLQWIAHNLGGLLGGATRLLVNFFIFMVALYYLLRDGTRVKRAVIELSPLADTDDETVFARLQAAITSVVRGSLTIALIQGVLTGIGFTIFGVPNSVLWGVVAAFAALIPGIGTSLVLLPGIAYLFITGDAPSALGLLLWSFLAVGLIDNFLGPKLVSKGAGLHPLLAFLSVFGGLAFFGPVGLIFGPIAISLLLALLSVHKSIIGRVG